ncbi:hydrogenase assembly chaperone hypC/hupF [Thiorhodococcus drewsii AZ1]|uniref:Hydrogenase assembly chaperone hypC/hupF n=1 Tax=Thiorhodococcus drewsii AZ1 TaxID=765913 RepID=G2DWF3_9GAMM|nr:HypC/HybG/HupF family hydrogenase formation chaperone [Thiorhodococcus drewsii]EGV33653.1 hydrogenase assembly chaperone hypC/hupF [Thiorhodococcus drewsii AZ1]
MCFAIPMQVRSIDGFLAHCEAKGVEREVSLFLMQHESIEVGDYLVVHLGQAIEKIDAERAMEAWEIYDAMLASSDAPSG